MSARLQSAAKNRPSPLQSISGWPSSVLISQEVPDLPTPVTKNTGVLDPRSRPAGLRLADGTLTAPLGRCAAALVSDGTLPRRDPSPLASPSRPVTPVSRSMNRLVFRPSLSVIFFFRTGIALHSKSKAWRYHALHPLARRLPHLWIEILYPPVGRAHVRVELVEYRNRQLFYYPGLLGGEVFLPASRGCLTVGFVRSLLVLGHILPRVPLDYPGKLLFADRDIQRRVESSHVLQGAGPQILVADDSLGPFVDLVGFSGVAEAHRVHVGPLPRELVRVGVGKRIAAPVNLPPFAPATLPLCCHG